MSKRISIFHIEKMFPKFATTIDYLIKHGEKPTWFSDTLKETGKNLYNLYGMATEYEADRIASSFGLSTNELDRFYDWSKDLSGFRYDPEMQESDYNEDLSDWVWGLLLLGFSPEEIMDAYDGDY